MIKKEFVFLIFAFFFVIPFVSAPSLNCSIVSSCSKTAVLYLKNETGGYNNAHAQNVSVATYPWIVCCDADSVGDTITVSCEDAVFLRLSALTNAHVQQISHIDYNVNACISAQLGNVSCSYGSCAPNEACLLSMASSEGDNTTNAHVASCNYYSENVCCSLSGNCSVSFVAPTPQNASRQIANSVTINASVNGTYNISECTLEWDNGTTVVNYSMTIEGSGNQVFCSKTMETVDCTTYWYSVYAKNINNDSCVSEKRTFRENGKPSKPILSLPANESHTTNRTPFFNWSASTDCDDDQLNYTWNLTCAHSSGGSCSPFDDRLKNLTETNYTPENFLKNFWDTLEYYNWTVKAWDGYEYSDVSDMWRFYVDSLVDLLAINDTVAFGALTLNQQDNTTDNNPYPISIYNNGNCFVNVSLNGTALWLSSLAPLPSSYYQFKVDFLELNSFNWAESVTSWTNVPSASLKAIAELNWSDETDSYETDIAITVPSDEPPGDKRSNLTFTGVFTDVAE